MFPCKAFLDVKETFVSASFLETGVPKPNIFTLSRYPPEVIGHQLISNNKRSFLALVAAVLLLVLVDGGIVVLLRKRVEYCFESTV